MPLQTSQPKIIVLDDDPTGSQTVHSCLLLLQWDVETLKLGLQDSSPIFFILTNTRSLTPEAAASTTAKVAINLKQALNETNTTNFLIVSRSDSTLRGHYPIETDIIAQHLGPFDAHFLTPQFFEAGRVTVGSTHYIQTKTPEGIQRIPTHNTEFAKDSVFGYTTSYLPAYVEEKTKGNISAHEVERFTLKDIRSGSLEKLLVLKNNACVCVDGEKQSDLDRFANDLNTATNKGKRFLFRSAASLLTALANLPKQPTAASEMNKITRSAVGAVIVGSHVQKTTRQLQQLLKLKDVAGIEVNIHQIKDNLETGHQKQLQNILTQVNSVYQQGKSPVIYTSREELKFSDSVTRLSFGQAVSALLVEIIQHLPADVGFLISKGGITSNDTLSRGLQLRYARLLGQIIPGVSIATTAATHPQFPNLPIVLFPGNVGDDEALSLTYRRLTTDLV